MSVPPPAPGPPFGPASGPRHEREVEAARKRRRGADPFQEGPAAARARKLRSLALAAGLIAFVVLIFAVTLIRLTANVHPHP